MTREEAKAAIDHIVAKYPADANDTKVFGDIYKRFYDTCETEDVDKILETVDECIAEVTKRCKEFYRDLCGTVYGNADKNSQGIMNEYLVAEHMHLTPAEAKVWLDTCVACGITERQGGAYVI